MLPFRTRALALALIQAKRFTQREVAKIAGVRYLLRSLFVVLHAFAVFFIFVSYPTRNSDMYALFLACFMFNQYRFSDEI
jgi:hypothetical protein